MHTHSRFWLFVLTVVLFLVLATAVCGVRSESAVAQVAPSPMAGEVLPSEREATVLAVRLLFHVVATAFGLRVGMKIFYESTLWRGFCAIILIDVLLVAVMELLARFNGGFSAMLGPQVLVTALFMVVTLRHFGFTKDRFTVIPTVLVAKAFGFFAEVVLRMLFLEALLRWAATKGW